MSAGISHPAVRQSLRMGALRPEATHARTTATDAKQPAQPSLAVALRVRAGTAGSVAARFAEEWLRTDLSERLWLKGKR